MSHARQNAFKIGLSGHKRSLWFRFTKEKLLASEITERVIEGKMGWRNFAAYYKLDQARYPCTCEAHATDFIYVDN